LKGFELKRRGELELIKVFQQEIFYGIGGGAPSVFAKFSNAKEVYAAAGKIANRYVDYLDSRG